MGCILGSILRVDFGRAGGQILAAVRKLEAAGRRGTIAAARARQLAGSFFSLFSVLLSLSLSFLSCPSCPGGRAAYARGSIVGTLLSNLRGQPPYLATFSMY